MDKAILVIDNPMFCCNCPLARERPHRGGYVCGIGHPGEYSFVWVYEPVDMDSETKPDWCPLKELPEKMEGYNSIKYQWGDYEDGWNHCIDCLVDE